MKKLLFIIISVVFISLSYCGISLSEEDSGVFVPEEVVTPISGLRPYVPVELEEVIEENRKVDLAEEIKNVSDEYSLILAG